MVMSNKTYSYEDFLRLGEVQSVKTTTVGGKEFSSGYTKEFYKNGQYEIFTRTKFVKRFVGAGRDIADVIDSDADLGKMYRIMRYIDNMNMIVYDNHDKKATIPADQELMLKLIGGHEKRAKEFLNKMMKLEIIKEGNVGSGKRYFINPIYTMASKGISTFVFKLFRESLLPHLSEQAVSDLDFLCYIENNPSEFIRMKEEYEAKQAADQEDDDARMEALLSGEVMTTEQKEANKQRYNVVKMWLELDKLEAAITLIPEEMTESRMEDCREAFKQFLMDNDLIALERNSKYIIKSNKS